MVNIIDRAKRVLSEEVFEIYEDKYVLLGHLETEGSNVISGIPVAVSDRDDRDYMWDLFWKYTNENTHGMLSLNYYGDVESVGVYYEIENEEHTKQCCQD